jgi:methionyl-tRNA formyltransferase
VYNLVRGITYPFPGAYTFFKNQKLIIWSCEEYTIPLYEGIIPGKVIKIIDGHGVVILCSKGAILLRMIQLEGGSKQSADAIIKSIRDTLV